MEKEDKEDYTWFYISMILILAFLFVTFQAINYFEIKQCNERLDEEIINRDFVMRYYKDCLIDKNNWVDYSLQVEKSCMEIIQNVT